MDESYDEMSRRVQVRFVTKLELLLRVPSAPIAIPANLTRLGLSTIVNSLLKSSTLHCLRFTFVCVAN